MEPSLTMAIVHILILTAVFSTPQPSYSTNTIIVDGFTDWKTTLSVYVGDSLVFKHNHLQNLYLFHNRKAFDLCIFPQASLIYEGNSSQFTWHPTRPGFYYFSARDKHNKSCEKGEKVPVRVVTPQPSPGFSPFPSPAPTSGGDLPSFPSHGWVLGSPSSPSPAPVTSALHPGSEPPSPAPASGSSDSGGIPFISSNPAVPVPTGETDTATIRPLPTPGDGSQVVGLGPSLRARMDLLLAYFAVVSAALRLWL